MERYVIMQIGIAVVAIVLLLTFYILLLTSGVGFLSVSNQLILIIIAIILLTMLGELSRIEYNLRKGKK